MTFISSKVLIEESNEIGIVISEKGLAKIIGLILGILGLSSKATSVKKSKIKKIDKQV